MPTSAVQIEPASTTLNDGDSDGGSSPHAEVEQPAAGSSVENAAVQATALLNNIDATQAPLPSTPPDFVPQLTSLPPQPTTNQAAEEEVGPQVTAIPNDSMLADGLVPQTEQVPESATDPMQTAPIEQSTNPALPGTDNPDGSSLSTPNTPPSHKSGARLLPTVDTLSSSPLDDAPAPTTPDVLAGIAGHDSDLAAALPLDDPSTAPVSDSSIDTSSRLPSQVPASASNPGNVLTGSVYAHLIACR